MLWDKKSVCVMYAAASDVLSRQANDTFSGCIALCLVQVELALPLSDTVVLSTDMSCLLHTFGFKAGRWDKCCETYTVPSFSGSHSLEDYSKLFRWNPKILRRFRFLTFVCFI